MSDCLMVSKPKFWGSSLPLSSGNWLPPTWTDFGGSQFCDDEGRDGPQNIGLLIIMQSDAAASPRTFYLEYITVTCSIFSNNILFISSSLTVNTIQVLHSPYFIWPTLLVTIQTSWHHARQWTVECHLNLLSGSTSSTINVLQLILGFTHCIKEGAGKIWLNVFKLILSTYHI